MIPKILLLLSLVLLAHSNDQQELDAIFNDLERQLNYKKEFTDLIDDVKKEVTKSPDLTTRTLGMAKALNLAVPKFQTGRSVDIAQGVLNVVSGITENLPFGQFIAPLASLISSIIGIVSGAKADATIRDVVQEVVRQESDHVLESQATASRHELTAAFNYLAAKHTQTLDKDDVTRMVGQIPVTTGAGILAMLESRIRNRATTSNSAEAKQGLRFCLLYAQIASFRDIVITDLIYQIRRAGDNDEANSYENAKADFVNKYRSALQFLNSPRPEQAGVISYYYPPGHDADSTYIKDFLKMAGVADPSPWLETKNVIQSVKWPGYHTFLHSSGYIRLAMGLVVNYDMVQFVKRSDGYWELKTRGKWLWIDNTYPDYVGSRSTSPGSDQRGHFIVVKYPGTNILTIASRKWPDKFWKGESNTYYVRLRSGNTGKDTQFYFKKCDKSYQTGTTYRCMNI